MSPNPSKIQDMTEWLTQTNLTEVHQFLGLLSYRHHILKFSNITGPLYFLTQQNVPFTWDLACSKAFDTLKSHLVQSPILAYPRFNQEAEPFILQTAIGLELSLNKMVM